MKKKIIIASAALFFALATMFNINALQTNNAGDISLDNIAIMAQATNEAPERPDVWYRRGVWTQVQRTRTLTLTATARMVVLTKAGPVTVEAGGTYVVEESFTIWDCIGWSGRC